MCSRCRGSVPPSLSWVSLACVLLRKVPSLARGENIFKIWIKFNFLSDKRLCRRVLGIKRRNQIKF